jgi:hypothetical protein
VVDDGDARPHAAEDGGHESVELEEVFLLLSLPLVLILSSSFSGMVWMSKTSVRTSRATRSRPRPRLGRRSVFASSMWERSSVPRASAPA